VKEFISGAGGCIRPEFISRLPMFMGFQFLNDPVLGAEKVILGWYMLKVMHWFTV